MKRFLSLFLVVIFLLFSSCVKKESYLSKFTDYTFDYFDTVTTIIGYEKNKEDFLYKCELIKEKLEFFHKQFNIYNKFDGINNLAVINDSKKTVTVDKEIINMLKFASDLYGVTNGKVNIAMGSVLSIWHDYRNDGLNNPQNAMLPDISMLKEAYKHTDISNLLIDETNNTVTLKDEKMSLDVGAIAKGYAVEQVALYMKESGIKGYILNVGGNVRIVGEKPDSEKWKVGIENPDGDEEKPYAEYLLLGEMSLVTSGSYQRFYTVNGKNYHHIIDPDTLMPSEYFSSVSVLTENSALADALSTAVFSMKYEDGKKIIESFSDTEAMWILPDGTKKYTNGFKKYIAK